MALIPASTLIAPPVLITRYNDLAQAIAIVQAGGGILSLDIGPATRETGRRSEFVRIVVNGFAPANLLTVLQNMQANVTAQLNAAGIDPTT